jgi:actin-related protein 10
MTTPRKTSGSGDPSTPTTRQGAASVPSPHYTTTRRHSLYGTEDRIILDPGSCVWKVGFSGEGRPRDLFYAGDDAGASLWSFLSLARTATDRDEEERMIEVRVQDSLRRVFFE